MAVAADGWRCWLRKLDGEVFDASAAIGQFFGQPNRSPAAASPGLAGIIRVAIFDRDGTARTFARFAAEDLIERQAGVGGELHHLLSQAEALGFFAFHNRYVDPHFEFAQLLDRHSVQFCGLGHGLS